MHLQCQGRHRLLYLPHTVLAYYFNRPNGLACFLVHLSGQSRREAGRCSVFYLDVDRKTGKQQSYDLMTFRYKIYKYHEVLRLFE